jgi:hypothetical protein
LNHTELLKRIFAQLPLEMTHIVDQLDWAMGRGYLVRAARAAMWDRPEDSLRHFDEAIKHKAAIDQSYLDQLIQHASDYALEFGEIATKKILEAWALHLKRLGGRATVRQFYSLYSINQAFDSFNSGRFTNVPKMVISSILSNPKHLTNRGILAIFIRSILRRLGIRKSAWLTKAT